MMFRSCLVGRPAVYSVWTVPDSDHPSAMPTDPTTRPRAGDACPVELSVVIPVYNEVESIQSMVRELQEALSQGNRSYEILLIDDGSTDGTWARCTALQEDVPALHLIRFRRNFGQTAAMSAGFDHARGDLVVTLDADLQNDPADIPRLLDAMSDDVDVVSGWRRDRKDRFLDRRLPSILANALISQFTGVRLHDYGCTLKVYRRTVLQSVRLYGEMHRFIPALVFWVGGNVVEIPVHHRPRRFGTSKYGLSRTFRVLLDLLTVRFLLQYSTSPIHMFGRLAALFALPGAALLVYMISANLLANLQWVVPGFSFGADLIKRPFWVMISFVLLFMGIQFVSIGLLAELQIRTYHESQGKSIYAVREIRPARSAGGPG
jgi:glycosyltransferase involved in cell wall biosynthesis